MNDFPALFFAPTHRARCFWCGIGWQCDCESEEAHACEECKSYERSRID